MKKLSLLNLVLVCCLAVGVATFSSCETDPCADVACPYGDLVESGDNCNCELHRAVFLGTYKLNESCPSGSVTDFSVTVTASSSAENKILITGFGGWEVNSNPIVVEATVDGDDVTVVANQSFDSGNLVINSGSGSISTNGNTITISYSYTFGGTGGTSETCSGTYTKQ